MTVPGSAVQSDGAPAIEPSAAPAEPQQTEVQQQSDEFNWEGGNKRDELGRWVTKVATEQDAQRILETIAAKETITLADLRTLPEAKGFSDEQLQKLWNEVTGTGNQAPPEPPKPTTPRAWKVYRDGQEVTDLSKMTAEEFLQSQIGYTANKTEQRRAFDEVIRNAQQGHYNAERMQALTNERNQYHQQWKALEPKVQQFEAERRIWDNALAAAARDDVRPMQALLQAYVEALGAPPQTTPQPAAGPSMEDMQAGWAFYNSEVLPAAETIAKEHGLSAKEVADGIMLLVDNEPELTRQRYDQIVQIEIPMLIQQMRAEAQPTVDPRDAEIERLKGELAKQRGTKVEEHNTSVQALHQRRRTAPPATPRLPANSAPEVSGIQDGQTAREWLRNWKG